MTENINRLFRVASYTWLSNIIICTVAMWSKFLICLSFTFLIWQLAFRRIVILWRETIIDQCQKFSTVPLACWFVVWNAALISKNVFSSTAMTSPFSIRIFFYGTLYLVGNVRDLEQDADCSYFHRFFSFMFVYNHFALFIRDNILYIEYRYASLELKTLH